MTVIRPNSISGVTSITALANEINVFRHNGVLAGLQLNGVNHHTSAGVSTFHTVNVLGNLDVAGVLTYQDVANVDSVGIITARSDIRGGRNLSIAGISTFNNNVNVSGTIETTGSELKITGAEPRLTFTDTDNNPDFQIWANAQKFAIYDSTNSATRFHINSSGRIGIGTETPDTLVEIGNAIGTGTANLLKLTSYTNSQSSRPALVFWNNNPNTAQAQISAKGGASYNASKLFFSVANTSRSLVDRICIDEYGTLIVGGGESRRNTKGSNQHQALLIEGTGVNSTRMSMIRSSNDDNGPEIQIIKTRGTSIGSVTKPNQNDYLGSLTFLAGDDNDLFTRGAEISVQATGTPANDRCPSDIIFSTAPTSGATTPQERLRITSDGHLGINVASVTQLANSKQLTLRPTDDDGIRFVRPGDGNNNPNVHLDLTTTTSGSAYPTGEAYTVKYKTMNCDQIFETYEGGGTGGHIAFKTAPQGGTTTERLTIHKNGGLQISSTGNVSPFIPNISGSFSSAEIIMTTPVYSEYHFTWSGQSSKTIDLTCPSYFHSEFIYVQHQTNGGSRMQQYVRGQWSNNHHQHSLKLWEDAGSGGGLSVSFVASDQSGGGAINGRTNQSSNGSTYSGFVNGGGESSSSTANGRLRISETYNWGSVSSRGLIVRVYYGSFAISKS